MEPKKKQREREKKFISSFSKTDLKRKLCLMTDWQWQPYLSCAQTQFLSLKDKSFYIQVALVIWGLFLQFGLFKIHESIPIIRIRLLLDFLRIVDGIGLKIQLKMSFLTWQCSFVIRGFIIQGSSAESIYRKLRGRPVHKQHVIQQGWAKFGPWSSFFPT